MHGLLPVTRAWFERAIGQPTEVQTRGWPVIAAGQSALLLAPTGSGKTLAAFLQAIDRLVRGGDGPGGEAVKGTRVLYVSPLKALVYDIERNLRAPLAGIEAECLARGGTPRMPRVDVRTGDTSGQARRKQLRDPAEILVTTPESLYLLLGSQARENLRTVETVIIDEVHALAPTKRGAHLAVSLERLCLLSNKEPQRIGLSATARPVEDVARFVGGDRQVAIVDCSRPPRVDLLVSQPVPQSASPEDPGERGMWAVIHPQLLSLVNSHRTTLIFVNSRGLCERLCHRLNELAGEPLLRSHHGSLSHAERAQTEEQLKRGEIAGIVATSSLELGVDMEAVDLVVMVESPGSVARGLQRVGRAGHGVGETSHARFFPKHRGELLECAVIARGMCEGAIEALSIPENALDVLAQQLVAMVASAPSASTTPCQLLAVVRRSRSYATLSEDAFFAVLDMLSGRYPSHRFADLRPRILWDRQADTLTAARGARMVALVNGGTIPDRGTYPVHLGDGGPRVGELDEEMVHETAAGEVFTLGATSWRVEEITRDRVVVSPAPGETGKLPFWHGDRPGRPMELGRALGALTRELATLDRADAVAMLTRDYPLDAQAACALFELVDAQRVATGTVPSDRTVVVECFRDELGDYRVCILTPFGARVHAPWALSLEAQLSVESGFQVQAIYGDDGIALRFSETDRPPPLSLLLPDPESLRERLLQQLEHAPLFAGLFRENATRALLMPRRSPTARRPLFLQRRRAAELLGAARQHPSFPIVIETYRACLQDVFDVSALCDLLGDIRSQEVEVVQVETRAPSPFARNLVLAYAAAFMYDGDAPRAERRAQALTLDQELLSQLLGESSLAGLLDARVAVAVHAELQCMTDTTRARDLEDVVGLLRRLGDLAADELRERISEGSDAGADALLDALAKCPQVVPVTIADCDRYIAVEDAALYHAALDVPLPPDLPAALREASQPVEGWLLRYAARRGPFGASALAARYGLPVALAERLLINLVDGGRLMRGAILPGGAADDFCDLEVLRRLKRTTLARLRREIAPVAPVVMARFLLVWHGLAARTGDSDGDGPSGTQAGGIGRLKDVLTQLEGVPLSFDELEARILPARVPDFDPRMLDELGTMGWLVWVGCGVSSGGEGRVALYRRAQIAQLLSPPESPADLPALQRALLEHLKRTGASFVAELAEAMARPAVEVLDALRALSFLGVVSNDTFAPLRFSGRSRSQSERVRMRAFGRAATGRWSLVSDMARGVVSATARAHANTVKLLERHGLLCKAVTALEPQPGGFSATYRVLRAMEDSGQVRRGHFVEDLGGAQFAYPGAVDRLRAQQTPKVLLARLSVSAVDPANPYGWLLPWPPLRQSQQGVLPRRVAGATVILVDGEPVLYLARGGKHLLTFEAAVDEAKLQAALSELRVFLAQAPRGKTRRRARIERIDGRQATQSPLLPRLLSANFNRTYGGLE